MQFDEEVEKILDIAWHQQTARSSLVRWHEVCEKENWGQIPKHMPFLIHLFGASWYFTRYVFSRGPKGAELIDQALSESFSFSQLHQRLAPALQAQDPEQGFERLRILKNEIMLQILIAHLMGSLDQEQTERKLTMLADATLETSLKLSGLHEFSDCRIAVLGMGRMAGYEMTFGSDLDLIFLFDSSSEESIAELSRKVRMLLRHLAVASSSGLLYEVDMRLRPHGTSGALLTANRSFIEYHRTDKEVWERQMMTRCRCVCDEGNLGIDTLEQVMPHIYSHYNAEHLRHEIATMRQRVLLEKGSPRAKLEIKRGKGGIMDIDFLTHYLQLKHGCQMASLMTCSTRQALRILSENRIIEPTVGADLLKAYDFLKYIESCVRLFDLKPVSTISVNHQENASVALATGFGHDTVAFMEKYFDVTSAVRRDFERILELH